MTSISLKEKSVLYLILFALCFVVMNDYMASWGTYREVAAQVLYPSDGYLYFDRACNEEQMQAATVAARQDTSLEERKKLRWAWKAAKQELFHLVNRYAGERVLSIFFRLFPAIFLFLTFFLIIKILNNLIPSAKKQYFYYAFFLYIMFLFFTLEVPSPEFEFSVVESFCVALALWACLTRRLLPYCAAIALAVLVRESGVIVASFWLLFYPRELVSYLMLLVGPLLLVSVNLDVLSCLLRTDFLVTTKPQAGQTMLLDHSSYNIFSFSQVFFRNFLIFWVPLIALRKYIGGPVMRRFIFLFIVYNILFLVGATFDHMASKLLLAPILIPLCLVALVEREKQCQSTA